MYKKLKPALYLNGFEELTPSFLEKIGVTTLLLDVDNTLSDGHDQPVGDSVKAHLEVLQNCGIRLCVLSNNNEARVSDFSKPLGLSYIADANKPQKSGVLRALKQTGAFAAETLMVGDQLFTDVWAANRCGVRAALVKPRSGGETRFIRFKRALEKPFLRRFERDETIVRRESE